MNEGLSHYAPIIVRSSVPTEWERKFCASIIAQERKGRAMTERQQEVMGRIVRKFQDATMRDDGVTE
ncbi:MAG: hypothetical protein ACLGIP_16665 [Alphaproteobacteria bacterium]